MMPLRAEQSFLIASEAPPPAPVSGLTPRPYQVDGIAAARRLLGEGLRRILLVLATGGGKTVVAALVALGALLKNKRVLFVGPRREIIGQAFWKLIEAGVPELDVGVIMADGIIPHVHTRQPYSARRPNARVQVASIQTLANRPLPPADVVFVDEAHHATSATWQKIIEHYIAAGATVVGLTATPVRADNRGLGGLFEQLHVIATFRQLADLGFLMAPRVFTTPRSPDLSKVKVTAKGEYDQEQLAKTMDQRTLVGDLVEHWQRHAEGRTTVVFAASVEHSRHVVEAFTAAGVAAAHIDGTTPTDVRDTILARLKRGELQVVSNMGVLTEGWDEPRVKCVVLARPTKSLGLFLQMVGRGLRPWENVSALLLDHAGATHEFGFVQDEREWSLDGRAKRKCAISVRVCPKCYAALPGGTLACTEAPCDFVFPIVAREVPEIVDGDLLEATEKPKPTMDERATFYEKTLIDGAMRGRKLGWCAHRYKEKFGIWPHGARLKALERVHYPAATPGDAPAADDAQVGGMLPTSDYAWSPDEAPPALDEATPSAEFAPPVRARARRIDLSALLGGDAPEPESAPAVAMEAWSL